MSAAELAAQALLWTGVAAQLVSCAGVWWMRDVFDRLHYTAASTAVGPVLIGTSVVVTGGAGGVSGTVEVVTACAVLLLLSPVVTHAVGRAARRMLYGDIGPGPGEAAES
ncbi:monovalent cation/H(+) antiporter subunit G [Actinomadura latina]|uniref:Monovalent cation/H(+) antiporter subunit G n=1 Tax=Actinomadura latina TaxID=163603 RepID=A0A846YXA0_9ACTN|nr:monovalent cation/H(+) antiporter subunit G [Actinomadura latina]NKZ03118.1 monovalent cation/H(+) antiporter subunit G [Actinomadura latina]